MLGENRTALLQIISKSRQSSDAATIVLAKVVMNEVGIICRFVWLQAKWTYYIHANMR